MSIEWICYLENQEFGPLSERDLMELIRDGTVPVNTYIRRPSDTEWTTIESVFGPNLLKRQEFSPHEAISPTSESRMISDSPTMVNFPTHSGKDWYWNVGGETFGPGEIEMVVELCQQGLINPDDFVRMGTSGDWIKAGTVEALFPATPSFVDAPGLISPPPPPPIATSVDSGQGLQSHSAGMLADETKLLQQLLDLLQKNPNLSQLAAPTSSIPADQQWYCLVSGHEVGPMSIETLVQMVLQGRVFPGDVIRLGRTGEWFPASSVEGLFPKAPPASGSAETGLPDTDSVKLEHKSDKLENQRNIPESERVLQGLDRLYKASEAAAAELAEKEMKSGNTAEGKKVIGSSTSPSASRKAADEIIRNYSQFAITSAEKKKAEALANRLTTKEWIRQNKKNIIIAIIVIGLLIPLLIVLNTALSP